jgi:hypothetical protein
MVLAETDSEIVSPNLASGTPGGLSMTPSRTLIALSLATVVAGAAACTYKPRTEPPNTGQGTVNQARKYLEGNWSLVSFTVYDAVGTPFAMKGTGTLVYDDFNNMAMDLNADPATAGLLAKAGLPMENNRFSTKGKVIVDMQNKTLKYVVEGQHISVTTGPMAIERLRYWDVNGNTLTLTTKDDNGKPLSVGKWQKQ